MGTAPPKDAPPPEEQDQVSLDAGFEPSPSGAEICGFGIPGFNFSLNFKLPGLPSFQLPTFNFMLALNCDLSDPIDASFEFGGGRVPNFDKDQDDEFAEG